MTRVKTDVAAEVIDGNDQAGAGNNNATEAAEIEIKPTSRPRAQKATTAKANPVGKTNATEAAEIETAKEGDVTFDSGGDKILTDAEADDVEIVVEQANAGRAKMLRFLEEPVTIVIAETTDDNAEQFVLCIVNGVGAGPDGIPYLPRGQEITIKRKYVEVLASARPVKVKSRERFNPESGEREIVLNQSSSLQYPFSVIKDTDQGKAWLRDLINQRRV